MSLKICIPAMAAFLLAACGGDDNKASDPDPSAEADFVVDTFGDLSVCTDKREGATAYVKDEEKDYICTDGDWTIDTNADTRKKSSDSKDDANSSNSKDKVKSSSSSCEDCKDEAISSNKDDVKSSSSSVALATPCKTETEDICEYGELLDTRDGQIYKTVKIGDQVWMAENLNYAIARDSYCYDETAVDPETENCTKYGRFYIWAATFDVCPPGWHLPDTTEWKTLFDAVGGIDIAGKMLKSLTGWNDYYDGTSGNGSDAYGFSALPAGHRNNNGYFGKGGDWANFWSATKTTSTYAYFMNLRYNYEDAYLLLYDKQGAFSVRCLKN